VGADAIWPDKWAVADEMAADPAFDAAIGVIGVHDNCGYPPGPDGDKTPFGYRCTGSATARSLGKPMWASEDGKLDATKGAPTLLREVLNSYNQAGITGLIEYPLATAMLDDLPLENRGLVTADSPWSGAYRVNNVTWSLAHVTQFVPQGWAHVAGANRALGDSGSFNTFESPDHRQWSLVVQNTGTSAGQTVLPQTLRVRMIGSLSARTVHVWATNLWSSRPTRWFVHRADVHPRHGIFTYTVPPGYAISFTSRSAIVRKGDGQPPTSPVATAALRSSYSAQPDATGMPRLLSPIDGNYSYEPCAGGRSGQCLGQQDPEPPVYWLTPSAGPRDPHALVGQDSWTDYTVSSDVLIPGQGDRAGLISRFSGTCACSPPPASWATPRTSTATSSPWPGTGPGTSTGTRSPTAGRCSTPARCRPRSPEPGTTSPSRHPGPPSPAPSTARWSPPCRTRPTDTDSPGSRATGRTSSTTHSPCPRTRP
jgi:hypothetical protein